MFFLLTGACLAHPIDFARGWLCESGRPCVRVMEMGHGNQTEQSRLPDEARPLSEVRQTEGEPVKLGLPDKARSLSEVRKAEGCERGTRDGNLEMPYLRRMPNFGWLYHLLTLESKRKGRGRKVDAYV